MTQEVIQELQKENNLFKINNIVLGMVYESLIKDKNEEKKDDNRKQFGNSNL